MTISNWPYSALQHAVFANVNVLSQRARHESAEFAGCLSRIGWTGVLCASGVGHSAAAQLFASKGWTEADGNSPPSGPVGLAKSSANLETVDANQFVGEATEAICSGISECCRDASFDYDAEGCLVNTGEALSHLFPTPGGAIEYDAEMAAECVRESYHRASACEYPNVRTAPCNRVMVGTLPLGSPCTHDSECASPDGGEPKCSAGADQVCLAARRGAAGDSCQGTCKDEGFQLICAGGGGVPEDFSWIRCFVDDGLFCGGEDDRVCQPLLSPGDPCDALAADASLSCTQDAYCDLGDAVCDPRVSLGEPCQVAAGNPCEVGGYCSPDRVCAERQFDGATCVGGFEPECLGVGDDATHVCNGGLAAGYVSEQVCAGSVIPRT